MAFQRRSFEPFAGTGLRSLRFYGAVREKSASPPRCFPTASGGELTMRFAVCMLLLTVSLFPGCGSDHRSFTVADPWLRLPPMEFILASDQKEISTDNFAVVTRKEAEALARLEESPCAKLSPQEAEAFLGKPFAEAGGQLVLLR